MADMHELFGRMDDFLAPEQPKMDFHSYLKTLSNNNPIIGNEDFTSRGSTKLGLNTVTVAWVEKESQVFYCPVYAEMTENGSRRFMAYITGPVDDVDRYIDLIDTLLVANPGDTYYIFIDSPGGRVSAGSIIASAIHHSKAEVYTVARGLCASAAALIHNAAKPGHALVGDMAVLMIHMSSHADIGVSTFVEERAANQVRYVNENLLATALEMGYITAEELASIQNGEEIFITAKEFRDRVNGQKQEVNNDGSTV